MKTFKTKTAKTATIIGEMTPTTGILYYTVEGITTIGNSLIPNNGYYYFIVEDEVKKVYQTKDTVFTKEQLNAIEDQLPNFNSQKRTFENLEQREADLFFLQISIQLPFNTTEEDWEIVINHQ